MYLIGIGNTIMNEKDKDEFVFIFIKFYTSFERKFFNVLLISLGPLILLLIGDSFVLKFTNNLVIDVIVSFMIWEIPFLIGVPAFTTLLSLFLSWIQCSTNKMVHCHLYIRKNKENKNE